MRFGGSVVPKVILNQGGDPFLMELYRTVGGVQSMHTVTVVNKRGGYCLHKCASQRSWHLAPPLNASSRSSLACLSCHIRL